MIPADPGDDEPVTDLELTDLGQQTGVDRGASEAEFVAVAAA
jgi:hypothetical protein